MRLVRFLITIGVTLILLSYIGPILEPSYNTDYGLNPGEFRGYVVDCNYGLDVRISSWNNEHFSVYFMTYEDGLRTLDERSLENVSVIQAFSNATSLNEHLLVPHPGWYAILVTPSNNETISTFEVEFGWQIPNQGLVLAGASFLIIGTLWFLITSRKQLSVLTVSLTRRKAY